MATSSDANTALVDGTAQADPCDTKTFNHGSGSMSYRDVADRAAGIATALAEFGLRSGERVLIMLPDGPGFVEAFVGVMQRSAVPLPVNPTLQVSDIAAVASEAGARLVMASKERIHALADLETGPPVPLDRPRGLWATTLRPS